MTHPHHGAQLEHGHHADHSNHDDHGSHAEHAGHAGHAGHGGHGDPGDHVAPYRPLCGSRLVHAVPVVAFSTRSAMLLGYTVPTWAGRVAPAVGTVMYAWGGTPFLTGAISEIRARQPGMMLLIGLA